MAKPVTVRLDKKGMTQLAQSAPVGKASVSAAMQGKTHAERIAPRGATGLYASSFEVEQTTVNVTTKSGVEKRAGAILRNNAPYSLPVEGTHSVLRRTVDSIENGG